MRSVTAGREKDRLSLSDQESELVKALLSGNTIYQSAKLAGYRPQEVYEVLQRSNVAAAIYNACKRTLHSQMAPKALLRLDKLLESPNERTALDAAKTVLQHAYSGEQGQTQGRSKPISEMSAEELRQAVEQGQRELANRSTKVLDAEGSAQGDAQTDGKPLDLLD